MEWLKMRRMKLFLFGYFLFLYTAHTRSTHLKKFWYSSWIIFQLHRNIKWKWFKWLERYYFVRFFSIDQMQVGQKLFTNIPHRINNKIFSFFISFFVGNFRIITKWDWLPRYYQSKKMGRTSCKKCNISNISREKCYYSSYSNTIMQYQIEMLKYNAWYSKLSYGSTGRCWYPVQVKKKSKKNSDQYFKHLVLIICLAFLSEIMTFMREPVGIFVADIHLISIQIQLELHLLDHSMVKKFFINFDSIDECIIYSFQI